MAQNDALNQKQNKAVRALLSTSTMTDAAARAGCGRRTLQRWLATPEFTAVLVAEQSALLRATAARLSAALDLAVGVLIEALSCEDPKVRLRAAGLLTSHYAGLSEYMSLSERVSKLEQEASNVKGS